SVRENLAAEGSSLSAAFSSAFLSAGAGAWSAAPAPGSAAGWAGIQDDWPFAVVRGRSSAARAIHRVVMTSLPAVRTRTSGKTGDSGGRVAALRRQVARAAAVPPAALLINRRGRVRFLKELGRGPAPTAPCPR